MATSASAFAAQLTIDLYASAPTCDVQTLHRGICGRPGGRAEGTCPNGHVETATVCPDCARGPLYCTPCRLENLGTNPLTLRTEVA